MLRFLSIRNLAVIDRLELEFDGGLNVLTGETGAGKSIIVGAVGLLVGGRASAEMVRTGEDQAVVEAVFEDAGGTELIVRREVGAVSGRSRAFLNNNLATSTALRETAGRLVDLHGQHEHQLLLDPSTHLDVLDAFASVQPLRARTAQAFLRWQELRAERDRLHADDRQRTMRAEFLEFQLQEIRRVAPRSGEDDELAATRQVLSNAERLQRLCADALGSLYEGDDAALAALAMVWKKLSELAAIDQQFVPYLAARETIKPQLEDLAYFLRSYSASFDASPARLQEVEDRLALLERLKRKHGPALADVLRSAEEMERELDGLRNADARVAELERALGAAREDYARAAEALSQQRRAAAAAFAARLETSLADLAMVRTRCDVRFLPDRGEEAWSERGSDQGEFYISPNPGEDLRPLARIASGGELSRIMLALKTLASTDDRGKTLIFDEVDAGIGGTVADVVGARLRALAKHVQVLCITHLPQIAAYGTAHYRIAKSVKESRTVTEVTRLSVRDREEEVARMIAGAEVSATVRASAREMLKRKHQRTPDNAPLTRGRS
jgi:DNA repair protein RecN (Recombination protein N)